MAIEGKVGDVSGIEGKIGDVSGSSTFEQVDDFLLQDRDGDRMACLEAKVNRLQNEIRGIARWLDLRIRKLEDAAGSTKTILNDFEDDLDGLDERVDVLEAGSGGGDDDDDDDGGGGATKRRPRAPRK
jgi:hypothetical protein